MSDQENQDHLDETFRIWVPQPDTELVMGKGDNNFVGIMGRVDYGGVFLGAGGFPKGIPSIDSSYAGFRKAHVTLGLGVGGVASMGCFLRTFLQRSDFCKLDLLINSVALGVGTVPGTANAIISDGTPSMEGTVALYGDQSVSLAAGMTFSATALLASSVNATLVASLNSVVAASVNGMMVGINGVKSATVSALESSVVGDSAVVIASRRGNTSVEGRTVEIGKASGVATPGQAYTGFATGGQTATERVDIRADKIINLEPGKATDKVSGCPTKIQATADCVRAETKGSALQLDKYATLHAGNSVLSVEPKGLKLVYTAVSPKQALDSVLKPAEIAWKGAYEAAEATDSAVGYAAIAGITAAVVGGAAGATAALAGPQLSDDPTTAAAATGGLAAGGMLVGSLVGGLTTAGTVALVQKVLSKKACEAAKKAADTAYVSAHKAAIVAERAAIDIQTKTPTNPKIDITESGVILSCGLNKISITASGIEITTAPGGTVKVNGHSFMSGGASSLDVM